MKRDSADDRIPVMNGTSHSRRPPHRAWPTRLALRSRAPLALMGILAVACGPDIPQPQPPAVTVDVPIRRDVATYGEFTGSSRAVESANIVARVPGTLERVLFEPSQIVRAGQLLFVIEQESYIAARDQARGSFLAAEAELARAESDLERVQLAIQSNAVSQQDLDRAQAQRDQAAAAVIQAQAALANAELNLSYTEVRSPIDGQVGRTLWDPGNLVGQGQPTLLTTVNKLDPMFVYFDAPEQAVLRLLQVLRERGLTSMEERDFAGQDDIPVYVATVADEGYPHEGYVDFISNTVDPATGTIEVRAVVPNTGFVLFPGLFVRVRVAGSVMTDAILVEEQALGTDLGGKYVLVVDQDNVVDQRYVELGPVQDDGFIAVLSGLEGTERYIVNGMLQARPGFPVTPRAAGEPPPDAPPSREGA